MCYCDADLSELRDDIVGGTVPDDALTRECCWRALCRARGWFYDEIENEAWNVVCRRRGMLLAETPR